MPGPQSTSDKVVLALSGNLMSSVVAALLKHQGFQVIGLHLRTDDASEQKAQAVSQKLGIQLVVEDASELLEHYVLDQIVHAVLANRKAEPMVVGHQKILIERLLLKAQELGCGKIATGHAARVALDPSTGLTRLLRATDGERDQSHLLFGLTSEQLRTFILPIGDLPANAVERLAIELELDPTKLRAQQRGFCDIADERFLPIAETRIPPSMKLPGQIKTTAGTVVGDHNGLYKYVRGQSKGLPLSREEQGKFVVVDAQPSTNTLIIGTPEQLLSSEVVACRTNWIQPVDSIRGVKCDVRVKPGAHASCRATQFENQYVHLEFAEPQMNIVPGQAIVFYAGDEVLGGAFVV